MPELPEVETVCRGIAPRITARTVRGVVLRVAALRWPVPAGLPGLIEGERVHSIQRRGKYLLLEFDAGWLILHLGMSGSLRWVGLGQALRPHDHVDLVFDDGILRLHDPRRFGAVLWHSRSEGPIAAHALLARLGVEPLETPAVELGQRLFAGTRDRRLSIKAVLLAGRLVVGVGNIYASESLFGAQIHPATAAGQIGLARYRRLAEVVRATLAQAIEQGGSSLRDFVASDGASGYFQLEAQVYDRDGQACRRCSATIERIVQQQRATFFCPTCQR